MRIFVLAVALILSAAATVHAAETPYRDDRSSAEAVVASFYNAINRAEYSRAYSYFGDNAPQRYGAFSAGYATTRSVQLVTGTATSEGAAGSTYFTLPVAIEATATSGKHTQFAGCYTLRLVQPQLQEPPFHPIHIEKAVLKAAKGGLNDILPRTCE